MEELNNQPVNDYRGQLRDRMKSRFPDRNFDAQDGLDSPNSLDQSIIEAFDADAEKISGYEENSRKITDIFASSPRAAIFFSELGKTHDPSAAIYKAYGRDAYNAFRDGDASELIAAKEAEDAKYREEDEAFQQQKAQNITDSLNKLNEWGDKNGLNDEQKKDAFIQVYTWVEGILEGIYPTELFDLVWKGGRYDADIEAARHEGEVAGRNAKIGELSRKRQESAAMPPALSGQGVRSAEPTPKKPTNDNPWML